VAAAAIDGCGRIYTAGEIAPPLAERGVRLSSTQVRRLVTGRPERLNLHTLMVLCEILDCTPNDLIHRVELAHAAGLAKRAVGESGVADIESKPVRIRGARPPVAISHVSDDFLINSH
jgi:DNA-binding Xre family transcriptional regulator